MYARVYWKKHAGRRETNELKKITAGAVYYSPEIIDDVAVSHGSDIIRAVLTRPYGGEERGSPLPYVAGKQMQARAGGRRASANSAVGTGLSRRMAGRGAVGDRLLAWLSYSKMNILI